MRQNGFSVMTPEEIKDLSADILSGAEKARMSQHVFSELACDVRQFRQQWEETYSRFENDASGELAYGDLLLRFHEKITPQIRRHLSDAERAKKAVRVMRSMLGPEASSGKMRISRKELERQIRKAKSGLSEKKFQCPDFEKPVFILSAPRAGSTLLFETLSQFPDVWTIGEESHELIEGIPELHPSARNYTSNRLTPSDVSPGIASVLRERFARQLEDRGGRAFSDFPICQQPENVRFLEKTPKNALRIPFLRAVFPDARFIFLHRDPRENISSLMEGWRSRRFVAYRDIPGWPYREWSFLLVQGWQSLKDRPLAEIAACQWKMANACILEDLKDLPASSWYSVSYADLVQEPEKTIREISRFSGFCRDAHIEQIISQPLPISRMALSEPLSEKWRKNEKAIAAMLPSVESLAKTLENLALP